MYCQNSGVAPAINYNDRQGARLATSTLISHGAKKIAMFSGLLDSIPMSNRMFGYQLALSDAKLPFDPSLLYIGDWSIDSGYKLASEMIKSGKIPDAHLLTKRRNGSGNLSGVRQARNQHPGRG